MSARRYTTPQQWWAGMVAVPGGERKLVMTGDTLPMFVLEDLQDIYVGVPRDGANDVADIQTIPVSEMTDKQFREWIVGKAAFHGVQILPTMGKISLETRLALINRLLKQGVRIYKAPPGTPRWTT